jgi:hypothetical protein
MKKYYSLCLISIFTLFGAYVLADEWLDIAQDIQDQVATEVVIPPSDQKQIDINLIWARQCHKKQSHCPTDIEKQSIKETVENLEKLLRQYQELELKSPVLEYIVNKAEILRAMTQDNVPPM